MHKGCAPSPPSNEEQGEERVYKTEVGTILRLCRPKWTSDLLSYLASQVSHVFQWGIHSIFSRFTGVQLTNFYKLKVDNSFIINTGTLLDYYHNHADGYICYLASLPFLCAERISEIWYLHKSQVYDLVLMTKTILSNIRSLIYSYQNVQTLESAPLHFSHWLLLTSLLLFTVYVEVNSFSISLCISALL